MRATPILVAAFIAAGCSFALAQAGGGGGGAAGGGASAGGSAGTGAAGAAAGGAAGTSAGSSAANSSAGSDQQGRRNFSRYRRGDDMAPLVIPREEAPVRMRTYRQW